MIQDATSANDPGKMDDAILKTLRSAIAPMVEVVRAEKAQGKELTDIQHVVLSMGHCLDLWTEADQKIAIALTVGIFVPGAGKRINQLEAQLKALAFGALGGLTGTDGAIKVDEAKAIVDYAKKLVKTTKSECRGYVGDNVERMVDRAAHISDREMAAKLNIPKFQMNSAARKVLQEADDIYLG